MRSSLLAAGCWGGGKRAQIEGEAPQIEGGESCQGLPNAQKPLLAEANLPTVGSWAMLVRPSTAVMFSTSLWSLLVSSE